MKLLAPDTLDMRFDELMELGRAKLPGLAPQWTDHNAHDPGITLMELLAWVTEAQLYSLGRTRRDQRAAFAALLGILPAGARAARGLIWSDRLDRNTPAATFPRSLVIPADVVVNRVDSDEPAFRPEHTLLWVPGRIRKLLSRLATGRSIDFTVMNERGGSPFAPFGTRAGPDDVLAMEFECRGEDGIFPPKRADADGALWSIGIRADDALTAATGDITESAKLAPCRASSLSVTLVTDMRRYPVPIVSDSSAGMLRTGVILLDLSSLPESPRTFTLEFHTPRGADRPPRLLRIEANVVPIVQGRRVIDELHVATGQPDWAFALDVPGLSFAADESPVDIELRDPVSNRRAGWRQSPLTDAGPDDAVYDFDTATHRVSFGNGVNGLIPPAGAQLLVSYTVCDSEQGNVAPNRKWRVGVFAGTFGVNLDAVDGGLRTANWIDERRAARLRVRDEHALVSADDIESAALALPLLEVARAWVLAPDAATPRTGVVTLVAMRARRSEAEAGDAPETRRWLDAIRARLTPRMPLASRLAVIGPRYVNFSIRAIVECARGADPGEVRPRIQAALSSRLALTGPNARRLGVPLSARDVLAWVRTVEGVQRVIDVRLEPETGPALPDILVPGHGLPRFSWADIDVHRPVRGGGA